jgi:hypothetical protein
MARYRMDIFEPRAGHVEPSLRERHHFEACDDQAAITEAKQRFYSIAAQLTLTNFCLYDHAGNVVCETVRTT